MSHKPSFFPSPPGMPSPSSSFPATPRTLPPSSFDLQWTRLESTAWAQSAFHNSSVATSALDKPVQANSQCRERAHQALTAKVRQMCASQHRLLKTLPPPLAAHISRNSDFSAFVHFLYVSFRCDFFVFSVYLVGWKINEHEQCLRVVLFAGV